MSKKDRHDIHFLEADNYTVTSGGHWFNATSKTVDEFVPNLLDIHSFDKLISRAVLWINSTDSIAMLLYFLLVFTTNTTIAAITALVFHLWWYFNKSAFVNLLFMPLLNVINKDFTQLLVAAVALSFLGIHGNYPGLIIGIIYFFLFKVGLLRMLLDRILAGRKTDKLPLNDRVFKMVLIRYAMYENMAPPEVQKIDKHVQDAVMNNKFNRRR
ncbi:MAG: hypothetical protein ACFCU6_12030 [Balneolaceae bacterium]